MTGTSLHVLYAAIAFLGIHLVSSTGLRAALIARLGENGWRALFSVASVATLGWLILAYGRAPYEPIWPPAGWARLIPLLVMPFAFVLFVASLTTPNPTTAGMERTIEARDPVKGIVTITRHPMLWAFALWALAHLVNKGDRASIVFFGALACLSLFGQVLIDRKKERQLGAAWGPFALRSSAIPFVAALQGRTRIDWRGIGWWRPALGLVLYAGFLFGHQAILGKSPWPL